MSENQSTSPTLSPPQLEVYNMLIDMGFTTELSNIASKLSGDEGGIEGALQILEDTPHQQLLMYNKGVNSESDGASGAVTNPSFVPRARGNSESPKSAQNEQVLNHQTLYTLALTTGYVKAVFVINKALQMSPGKIASQVSHAALSLARKNEVYNASYNELQIPLYRTWIGSHEKIVVLESQGPAITAKSDSDKGPESDSDIIKSHNSNIDSLLLKAQQLNLPVVEIHDAGRTEVIPGTRTVIGIGPGPEEIVNQITGELGLLR